MCFLSLFSPLSFYTFSSVFLLSFFFLPFSLSLSTHLFLLLSFPCFSLSLFPFLCSMSPLLFLPFIELLALFLNIFYCPSLSLALCFFPLSSYTFFVITCSLSLSLFFTFFLFYPFSSVFLPYLSLIS